jgi:hypothetical protein
MNGRPHRSISPLFKKVALLAITLLALLPSSAAIGVSPHSWTGSAPAFRATEA